MKLIKSENSLRAIKETGIPLLDEYKDARLVIYIDETDYVYFEINELEDIIKTVDNSEWEILYISPDYYDFTESIDWENVADNSLSEEEIFVNFVEQEITELIYRCENGKSKIRN
jgi:hypothetical protein